MKRAITILTENFSDWETALINSCCRGYYGFDVRFAAPGGRPVTSSGGLMVTPHLAIEAIRLERLDLLIVCGGTIWKTPQAPDVAAWSPPRMRKERWLPASATERGRWPRRAC
ncbi:Uncharacterised protein [Chromobacterium violaceum]|uniref:DJ-1/PfpI domain-containing protein n=1 Tax=Chromobacterium violaceum TaxID=536 RepID=A0A447TD50_CHRVL|nr:Uncharacterised protein [Chromobacterium violaceum]